MLVVMWVQMSYVGFPWHGVTPMKMYFDLLLYSVDLTSLLFYLHVCPPSLFYRRVEGSIG